MCFFFLISYIFFNLPENILLFNFIKNLHKIWHSQYLFLKFKIFMIEHKNSELKRLKFKKSKWKRSQSIITFELLQLTILNHNHALMYCQNEKETIQIQIFFLSFLSILDLSDIHSLSDDSKLNIQTCFVKEY